MWTRTQPCIIQASIGKYKKGERVNDEGQKKSPKIGHKMRAAIDYIKLNPNSRSQYIDRLFGQGCSKRLIARDIVSHQAMDDGLGDRLRIKAPVDHTKSEPEPEDTPPYQLIYPRSGMPREKLIAHNLLFPKCPVCKSPGGSPCISTKTGQVVRFPHGERTDQLIIMLLILAENDA